MPTITEDKKMNNVNIVRAAALAVAFISGGVAYHTYFKTNHANYVELKNTKSGKFVIINDSKGEGHIYELNELEPVPIPNQNQNLSTYSSGTSQSYQLPMGNKH